MMLPHMLQDFAARDKVPAAGGKVPEERTPSTFKRIVSAPRFARCWRRSSSKDGFRHTVAQKPSRVVDRFAVRKYLTTVRSLSFACFPHRWTGR